VALAVDVMKPGALGFVLPGMSDEYGSARQLRHRTVRFHHAALPAEDLHTVGKGEHIGHGRGGARHGSSHRVAECAMDEHHEYDSRQSQGKRHKVPVMMRGGHLFLYESHRDNSL